MQLAPPAILENRPPPGGSVLHPGSAWYGAWYLAEVVDILTRNPDVRKKTIFVLCYDENDGYFDHVPPFVAPDPVTSEGKHGKAACCTAHTL